MNFIVSYKIFKRNFFSASVQHSSNATFNNKKKTNLIEWAIGINRRSVSVRSLFFCFSKFFIFFFPIKRDKVNKFTEEKRQNWNRKKNNKTHKTIRKTKIVSTARRRSELYVSGPHWIIKFTVRTMFLWTPSIHTITYMKMEKKNIFLEY